MRTKEELYNELRNNPLPYETDEPKVSSSLQACKNKVFKCCVSMYLHTKNREKYRYRITITLDSKNFSLARKEQVDVEQRCQEAIHRSFIARSNHELVETMNKWIDILEKQNRLESSTIYAMRERMKVIARYFGEHIVMVEEFTPQHCVGFCDWCLTKGRVRPKKGTEDDYGLDSRTIRDLHSLLNNFFSYALEFGAVASNPITGTKIHYKKKNKVDDTRKCWLDKDEYLEFKNWLVKISETEKGKHFSKLIDVCDVEIYTGMRREELLALKWFDYDEHNMQLEISATRVRVGSEDVYKKDVKNKSSHRIYSLTEPINRIFLDIRERQQALGIYNQDGFIFVWMEKGNSSLGKEYDLDYISKLFKKAINACDCIEDKSLHFHNLRHSCCSIMFSLGFSLAEVQAWLGHEEDSEVTMKVYNHYKNILSRDRVAKLDIFNNR